MSPEIFAYELGVYLHCVTNSDISENMVPSLREGGALIDLALIDIK